MMASGKDMIASVKKRAGRALPQVVSTPKVLLDDRRQMVESSQKAALSDREFQARVQRGDSMRDQGRWAEAAVAYAAALDEFPYERTYWIQLGHMAKEQGNYCGAEIAYRTACALGAPVHDVVDHLRFVLARQGIDEARYPIRLYRNAETCRQVPAKPDILCFARLLWGVRGMDEADLLTFLRDHDTCDELVAAMIRDPRFERTNREWLELVREDEL